MGSERIGRKETQNSERGCVNKRNSVQIKQLANFCYTTCKQGTDQ